MSPAIVPGIFRNAMLNADGIWRTAMQSPVSYGADGHDNCHGVEDGSFWFAHRNNCIAAAIGRFPADPSRPFVDVGGGNGFVAEMVRTLGYDVVLVEPGATGIRNARSRGLEHLVQASIADLQVEPGSLGAIGMFDVLEHIEDDAAALQALHGMLAEGGKLYATVPAHRWLWSSADADAGHFRRYTAAQLRKAFTRSGFDVELCSYFFWPLPAPMYLLRSMPERLGVRGRRPSGRRIASEHRQKGGIIDAILSPEPWLLRHGWRVPFGASCLIVASRGVRPASPPTP